MDHPEYGVTSTLGDGSFVMGVNGGGPLRVEFALIGQPVVQRSVDVPWDGWAWADDVVPDPRLMTP